MFVFASFHANVFQETLPGIPGQPDQQSLSGPRPPLQLQWTPAGVQEVQGGGDSPWRGGQLHLLQQAAWREFVGQTWLCGVGQKESS